MPCGGIHRAGCRLFLRDCAGLAAREWPGPVVDTCGINDRRVPPLRRAGLDPVEVLRPAWVLEAAAGRPGYELVASGYEHTRHGWRAWRLLRRREDAPPPGLLDRLKQWATSPIDTTREQLEQIRLMLDQLVERLITLIVVFALQTVVLPLLLAWGVLQVCRGLLAAGAPSR